VLFYFFNDIKKHLLIYFIITDVCNNLDDFSLALNDVRDVGRESRNTQGNLICFISVHLLYLLVVFQLMH
jgi:hypothetical protein